MTLQTEFEFTLPIGFIDEEGSLHRDGIMRLATAADEIMPLNDPRVRSNPVFKNVILLSRVITRIGARKNITPKTLESLFMSDLQYLHDFYDRINGRHNRRPSAICPKCGYCF